MNTVLVRLDDCYDSHRAIWINVKSIIKIEPYEDGSCVRQVDGSMFTVNDMKPDALARHIQSTTLAALGYT